MPKLYTIHCPAPGASGRMDADPCAIPVAAPHGAREAGEEPRPRSAPPALPELRGPLALRALTRPPPCPERRGGSRVGRG
jgi:hypothetical protein